MIRAFLSWRLGRVFLATALLAAGCTTVYRTVKESDIAVPESGPAQVDALTIIAKTLADAGFQIQTLDRARGLVATEWRTYATLPTNPPIDVRMQIQSRLQLENGRLHVKLTPLQREVNRRTQVYSDKEVFVGLKESNSPTHWKLYAWGAELYADIVSRLCTGLGASPWAVHHVNGATTIDSTGAFIRSL